MKKVSILTTIIILTLLLFGCKSKDKGSIEDVSKNAKKQENIDYSLDQILLSKSFQSTEPSIEAINKKDKIKISASLGIVECSGIRLEKIVKNDNDINIHISAIYEEPNIQLAVPQIALEIPKLKFNKFEDLKFNIISDNYDPVKIKFGVNEILSKVKSHFQISPCQPPSIDLSRSGDTFLWSIYYKSIIDREDPEKTLINLYSTLDALSGDIIDSEKTLVSSPVDDGHILDYASNDFILYKKALINGDEKTKEQLWSYNLGTKEKEMLFSSPLKIHSAKYSSDLSNVSIIESSDETSQVYIVPKKDKKAYKISFEDIFNPLLMAWKDDNTLYLIENKDDKSNISSYNVNDSVSQEIASIEKNIDSLLIKDNTFLIEESSEDEYNKKISQTKDWQDFNFIDFGFKSNFIGKNSLAYLEKDEKLDTNSLIIYDIESQETTNTINENISNFQSLSNNSIFYVYKNLKDNNFTLKTYNLDNKEKNNLGSLTNDKIYLDTKKDILYSNITLPFDNINPEIIYSINLSKLE